MPARPGITNALGCVVADLRHDFVQTVNRPVHALDAGELAGVFAEQAAAGKAMLDRERVAMTGVRHVYSVDMQFVGQTHLLRVLLGRPDVTPEELQALFEDVYFARFKVRLPEIRAQVVNANCSVVGERAPLDLSALVDPVGRKATLEEAQTGARRVRFEDGWHETPVYWRDHLPLEFRLEGPGIVAQMDTTVLIEPGCVATGMRMATS